MAKGRSRYISKQTNERKESTLMKPTFEILERIRENSTNYTHEVFTRLYRYLLREDIYYDAYQKLYANKGKT
jgi:hypothetical protein